MRKHGTTAGDPSRILGFLLGVIVLSHALVGCVRIAGEPETLTCSEDEDCPEGMECAYFSGDMCVPEGYCEEDQDCEGLNACIDDRCAEVECRKTQGRDAVCGNYKCASDYKCHTSCAYDVYCQSSYGCVDDACVPVQ